MFRTPLFQCEWHSSSTPNANTCTQLTHNNFFLSHQGLTRKSASLSSQGKFDLYLELFDTRFLSVCFVMFFCFILLGQFLKYVEQDEDINPPIKLEPCLSALKDQVYLTEPLVRSLRKALFSSLTASLSFNVF